jgi:hypothetical protein
VLLLCGCSKDDNSVKPEEQQVRYLTSGAGNRVWHIRELYENRIQIRLTANQMNYTKTYTRIGTQSYAGTFTDSDGYAGKWVLNSLTQLIEVINNNPNGDFKTEWNINLLNDTTLDIESTGNGKTIRIVLYAL